MSNVKKIRKKIEKKIPKKDVINAAIF